MAQINLPFKVGHLVEVKSFEHGYCGAWFKCKIIKIYTKEGKLHYSLEYLDYEEEELHETQVYQKFEDGEEECLMVRPPYPPLYQESELLKIKNEEEPLLVAHHSWKVGDLVDWWKDDCFWSGTILKMKGNDAVQIELTPPPHGEGENYRALRKYLRPSLEWSLADGWKLPTTVGQERQCAKLVKRVNEDQVMTDVCDIEKEKTDSVKKQKTESSEKEKKSSVEKQKTERIEKEKTNSVKKQKTESTEKEKTNSVKKQKTESTEKEKTSSVKKQKTESTEKEKTNSVKKQKTGSTEKEKTSSVEKQKTESIEKEKTNSVEKQKTESIEKEKTNSVKKQKTESIEKEKTNSAKKQKTESIEKEKTDSVKKQKTESSTVGQLIESEELRLNINESDSIEAAVFDLEELIVRIEWLKGMLSPAVGEASKAYWKYEDYRPGM